MGRLDLGNSRRLLKCCTCTGWRNWSCDADLSTRRSGFNIVPSDDETRLSLETWHEPASKFSIFYFTLQNEKYLCFVRQLRSNYSRNFKSDVYTFTFVVSPMRAQITCKQWNFENMRFFLLSEDNSCQLVTEESTSTRRWPAAFLRDNDKLNDTEARRDRMSSRSLCFLLGGQVEGKDRRGHCLTRSNVKARHSHLHQGVFYASVKRAY